MKFISSIKENFNGYLASAGILMFTVFIIHKLKFKTPPLNLDMLVTSLVLAPFLLFGLMCFMILLLGDKE